MSARALIACLGAGRMARGIAVTFAYAGHPVVVIDVKRRDAAGYAQTAAAALTEVRGTLATLASFGLFDIFSLSVALIGFPLAYVGHYAGLQAKSAQPQLILTTANAATQRTLTPFRIRQLVATLAPGERIARDLHDSLGQHLTALTMGLKAVDLAEDRRERDYDHRHEFTDLPEGDIFEALFSDSCFVSMSSAMLRRSLVNALGAIPDEIETCPDYWLFLAVTANNPARAVQTVVCRYRVHPGSMSRQRARRVDEEMLWLLDQWQWRLPADLVAWRRRVLNTLLAFEDLRRPGHRWSGLARLWREGSLPYLLSRPAARAWRSVRRTVATPRWRLAAPQAGGRVTA